MFGISLGEILLVLFIIFFISPKDLPKALKKIGLFLGSLERMRDELFQIRRDMQDIVEEVYKEKESPDKIVREQTAEATGFPGERNPARDKPADPPPADTGGSNQ